MTQLTVSKRGLEVFGCGRQVVAETRDVVMTGDGWQASEEETTKGKSERKKPRRGRSWPRLSEAFLRHHRRFHRRRFCVVDFVVVVIDPRKTIQLFVTDRHGSKKNVRMTW